MNRPPPSFLHLALGLSLTAVMLSGCIGGAGPPAAFYTLSPIEETGIRAASPPGVVVAVLPVGIPSAIDRPQVVIRADDHRIQFSEFHRWAGALADDLARVLIANLNTLLAPEGMLVLSDAGAPDPGLRLSVTVDRLDGRPAEAVWLNANWTIRKVHDPKAVILRSSFIREPVGGEGYAELVAAQSRALAALSREIALEFRKLR
jgi:uncharacterized protein